ncbi:MAG: hypothetical protein N3E46_04420, partial [Gemmataceae bacterium]|nr:hypothetical protein [Gemmataceae bacterium]
EGVKKPGVGEKVKEGVKKPGVGEKVKEGVKKPADPAAERAELLQRLEKLTSEAEELRRKLEPRK